jgi:hypothetical protein
VVSLARYLRRAEASFARKGVALDVPQYKHGWYKVGRVLAAQKRPAGQGGPARARPTESKPDTGAQGHVMRLGVNCND